MIAVRDDPQRAPWLGAEPLRTRMIALGISGGIAGLSGALYLASTHYYLENAFAPTQSLKLLSWAVVGGLGSPAGALFGALAVMLAGGVLPQPWHDLAPGLGVLLVVIFRPAGLSRVLEWARDKIVAVIAPASPAVPRDVADVRVDVHA